MKVPNRILREGLLDSGPFNEIGELAQMLFVRLLLVADDFGKFDGRLSVICRRCWPVTGPDEDDVSIRLATLEKAGLIKMYAVDGKAYLVILEFRQRTRARVSKYPSPDECQSNDGQMTVVGQSYAHGDGDGDGDVVPTTDVVGVPDGTQSTPNCPHEQIIAAYHEMLPTNPKVLIWDDRRRGYLKARWREMGKEGLPSGGYTTVEEGLKWWRNFFDYVAGSKFLTGRTESKDRKPFLATLEWLVRSTNFAKVIEGNYHR